jgi:CRP/FNR family cyclic AMP-dependent transcriptional regulator
MVPCSTEAGHESVQYCSHWRDLIDQLFNSSEKRLARLLLLLASFDKEGRPEPIVGKIEMIGTTRARVSHFMNKFRKLGFIEYNET